VDTERGCAPEERARPLSRRSSPVKSTKAAALVLADTEEPDVLVRVHDEPLLAHAVRGLFEAGCVDRVVVAASARRLDACEKIVWTVPGAAQRCRVLSAGADRAESIRLAFSSLGSAHYDAILIHEAARALVPAATVRAVTEAVCQGAEAVVPVLPVTDTVKLVDEHGVIIATEDRARLRTVQTPYGCTEKVLREACERGIDPLAALPGTVRTVAGHANAIRLATPFDLAVAEALILEEQA
jgi:2-C-methyl-D-erythritol 4-phosphate cytidylyltransferase